MLNKQKFPCCTDKERCESLKKFSQDQIRRFCESGYRVECSSFSACPWPEKRKMISMADHFIIHPISEPEKLNPKV